MKRIILPAIAVLSLQACDPAVPDSGAGGNYGDYLSQADRQTRGSGGYAPAGQADAYGQSGGAVGQYGQAGGASGGYAASDSSGQTGQYVDSGQTGQYAGSGQAGQTGRYAAAANATAGSGTGQYIQPQGGYSGAGLDPDRPRGDAPAGIREVHSEVVNGRTGAPVPDSQLPSENRAAISDEQNFAAVKSRVSIEQDRERLERMRQEYQVIPPQPVPSRPGSDGPNLAAYAINTHNQVGQQIYKRFNLFGGGGSACGRYTSPDLAQEAFLQRGGPQRDPLGLDPDGDGFACSWNPAPFRAAMQ